MAEDILMVGATTIMYTVSDESFFLISFLNIRYPDLSFQLFCSRLYFCLRDRASVIMRQCEILRNGGSTLQTNATLM